MSACDPLAFFRLKPIRVARVSEISEATAASSVPPEERINFHIGNPLQDERLSSAFLRLALGLDVNRRDLCDADPDALLEHLGWEAEHKPKLEFLSGVIRRSSPYMPRGGYNRRSPHALVKRFQHWLENQQDPLQYDIGEKSGRREIILASGGIDETLRLILWAISSYLQHTPARLLCYRWDFPEPYRAIPNLLVETLSEHERTACREIEEWFTAQPDRPTFLIIGGPLSEETRRRLRLLSLEFPLFFIEANDAWNHHSLAREARLVQRVIRLLTPGVFAPRLLALSTVFVLGNAEFLSVIENVHFQLKGTPSASEVELLTFLLEQRLTDALPAPAPDPLWLDDWDAEATAPTRLAIRAGQRLDRTLRTQAQRLENALDRLTEKSRRAAGFIQQRFDASPADEFAGLEALELLEQLFQHAHEPEWGEKLQRSFLSAFVRHQPQYRPEACLVTSGSSRTALGLLGFHCGLTDVLIPDLSWSYEQCFPNVHVVPLTPDLALDVNAMIARLEQLCRADPHWPERGAVAVNNPHNATGRIFAEADLRRLILYCLERGIYVIDDLAYQNVAPLDDLPLIKTARQIADDLVREGRLSQEQTERLITVHSMSKTDCLAGARLSVVEIRESGLRERFRRVNDLIVPNLTAIFIAYLFYRGPLEGGRTYWRMRNALFAERTQALLAACQNLPAERNPYGLKIVPPAGSMYPLLHVERLPNGLSLDWLASSLARRGIGLLPLATFARTEEGFDTGRSTFRLTLGGVDPAETMRVKTRRLLIDLNRLIAEEDARYNRRAMRLNPPPASRAGEALLLQRWEAVTRRLLACFEPRSALRELAALPDLDPDALRRDFLSRYLPERLERFRTRLRERGLIQSELLRKAAAEPDWLAARLEVEFMKDSLARRRQAFRLRTHDRTVHPTQKYALQAEMAIEDILRALLAGQAIAPAQVEHAARQILHEFVGLNVSINSQLEADEILVDFDALAACEDYTELFGETPLRPFLSFWSDWDGSNRPSGQGHRLAAAAVMENVRRMARLLGLIHQLVPNAPIAPDLLAELEQLPRRSRQFTDLLNDITQLTHQLEQRYRGILPVSVESSALERLATRLHLRRDPTRALWQHNDRYEQKMLAMRRQRRDMLETYFALNKKLRKQLHALIPSILAHRAAEPLLREVVGYHDLLQRIVITPRIHQGMINARDQFAIETTAFNLHEINALGGKYGNPGLALGLQISMSTHPDALIALDRKMGAQLEQAHRQHPEAELPLIWLIPLFEDYEAVRGIPAYLDRVWDYANQSRHTDQSPQQRFTEILCEVFIAGSDLSQQIGQANGAYQYLKAKYALQTWLAEHGVAEMVRIKLGSGEPMQRQGGYYSEVAGQPAFVDLDNQRRRLARSLPPPAQRSARYAVTPLQGVFLGGDLRTLQSSISEDLRFLPVQELASLLYHIRALQSEHRQNLLRAAETLTESRLGAKGRGAQELERLTIGLTEVHYESFLQEATEHFRHILYGRPEDVFGIHVISYFIGRSIPQLRDRPTSRRRAAVGADRGQQILASVAEMIPLCRQGSMLRAIAHNQAQTVVLGQNQLTTGLFLALEYYAQKTFPEAERDNLIAERLLPYLPVYEILHTLRLYQDWRGKILERIETAFPPGNSALAALHEDHEAMLRYLPLFQQELLRRHGLNVSDFFSNGAFIPDLLPALRPDLAVLLQADLFNTDLERMLEGVNGRLDPAWRQQTLALLALPEQVRAWRKVIWDLMGDSIYQRVQSFTELATALSSVAARPGATARPAGSQRLPSALTAFLRSARMDDEMRQFLVSAAEQLSHITEGSLEVPVSVIRALNDVERLAMLEEVAIPADKQASVRCCLLQIARLTGDNG